MIDKRMYRETFSQLRASDQAKQEVLQKMQEMKQRKRMPRVLRGAALAAAVSIAQDPSFENKKAVVILPDRGEPYLDREIYHK